MRRSLLSTLGILALTLAVPSVALAHHGHGHHRHRGRTKSHHAKFRHVHIGPDKVESPGATPPAMPAVTPENAGTVASYTNGVLTLTLGGGSTVSGKVTDHTRIACLKAPPTAPPAGAAGQPNDRGQGEDQDQGGDQGQGGDGGNSHAGMSWRGDRGDGEGQAGDHGKGEGKPGEAEPPCDSSALVSGAVVRAAELLIGPGGDDFESVWLVR